MKLDKTYANDVSIVVQNLRNAMRDETDLTTAISEYRKMQFDSYKAAGFTDEQALRLVEADIKKPAAG